MSGMHRHRVNHSPSEHRHNRFRLMVQLLAAAFFNGRYEELKADLARGLPQVSVDIEDVYGWGPGGGLTYNQFARW